MKKSIVLSLVLAGTLFLGGCSLSGGNSNTKSNNTNAPTEAQSMPKDSINVNIQNFAFTPATLTVKKGTTVTWTNNDNAPHDVKSASFSSERLSKGDIYSFTFNDTGTFDYICSIHPSMIGKIIVE